jgi:4'-phosphopantetheinyl transferase
MSPAIYWTMVQADQMPLDYTEDFLSNPELLKLSSLRFPKRRDEWLLGRWAAKCLVQSISPYQGYSLSELDIRNNVEGAPFIQQPDGAVLADSLSISHSHRRAVCALSLGPDLRIGADLEKLEARTEAFVADYFTPAEQTSLNGYPSELRQAAVNLIWSMKESMLKALGVGLRWDTRTVEIHEIEGLSTAALESPKWQKMHTSDHESGERHWAGWWQLRKNFVITLAGFTRSPADLCSTHLVEKWIRKNMAEKP